MMECPCQSHENFQNCCEPYLKGQKNPDTAEKLMRSRYTAYTQNQMDYILETHDPKTREEFDLEASKAWAQKADWLGLEIQNVAEGGPEDQEGSIEFVAKYSENGVAREHREESQFRRYKGQWYFVRGKHPEVETFVRTEEKVGRNDPCPCGSGKKHKKCCG